MTVAELHFWAFHKNWGKKRLASLGESLKHYVVIPYDASMAEHWGRIRSARRKAGKDISCGDAWIAATALRHRIPLLTHNGEDFAAVEGLEVVSAG